MTRRRVRNICERKSEVRRLENAVHDVNRRRDRNKLDKNVKRWADRERQNTVKEIPTHYKQTSGQQQGPANFKMLREWHVIVFKFHGMILQEVSG